MDVRYFNVEIHLINGNVLNAKVSEKEGDLVTNWFSTHRRDAGASISFSWHEPSNMIANILQVSGEQIAAIKIIVPDDFIKSPNE